MKIMIINPNSSQEMSNAIQTCAEQYAAGDFEVKTVCTPGAPEFIDYYSDQAAAAPGMIQLVKEFEDSYDAFIIACHCDPNLDLIKQISKKPVVGIGEASMHLASMLGSSFSVVSTAKHSIPNKLALVHKYHLDGSCASVRSPKGQTESLSDMDSYLSAAHTAIDEDDAEVIVLGCAGFAGMSEKMQEKLGVPVLDGIVCALIIAQGLVRADYNISKIRRYQDVSDQNS